MLSAPYDARITGLRNDLLESGIDCLLVSSRENIRYLVGFTCSSGWTLVSQSDVVLATDARYIEQARRDLGESCARLADGGLTTFACSYVSSHEIGVLGFESEHLSYAGVEAIRTAIETGGSRCELRPTSDVVEKKRMVKDDTEIAAMRRAAALADGAVAHARKVLRPGMTERQLAWILERWMRNHGSGPMPFPIIVASGPNSALPHAIPGDRPFQEGEPIIIDMGATYAGYCSDITRTFFLERMSPEFDRIYRTVLCAHHAALRGAHEGMRASDVDDLARSVIRDADLGDAFTHGLGHGVGLEVHEKPTVNSRSADVLPDRTVVTIEPGVYLPGQGGVRIEDTAVMLDGRLQSFSRSDKEDPVVTVHSGPQPA